MKTISTYRAIAAIALGLCAAMPVRADFLSPPTASLFSTSSRSTAGLFAHSTQPERKEIASVAAPHGALGVDSGDKIAGARGARGWVVDNALALALFAAVFVGLIAFQRRSADV